MSKPDIIRAWKDDEYRHSLSSEEQQLVPENPAGQIELTPEQLEDVEGGSTSWTITLTITVTVMFCQSWYNGGSCPVGSSGCC